jgi:hypothetical protein
MRNQIQVARKGTTPLPSKSTLISACLFLGIFYLSIFKPATADTRTDKLPISAGNTDAMTLQQSKPLVTRAGAWQTWSDHLHLKSGQDKLPLVLSFINGVDGKAKFTGLQVQLARKPLANLTDFGAAPDYAVDLTGKLTTGNTPITVQGFGPSGGRLVWKLITRRPLVFSVKPEKFGPNSTVTVIGRNFSDQASEMKVLIGTKAAKILSTHKDELKIETPAGISGGAHNLVVSVHSIESNVFKVSARAYPKILWVDFLATPPGQPVMLSGHGFSPVPAENHVAFGTIPARVLSSNPSQITCVVPDMPFPQWYVPISVTTHGLRSKERVTINVDQRVIPNEGIPMF